MYKIQNCSGGPFCLVLEKGSIILQAGQYLDLDGICSRKWIKSDSDLIRLITRGTFRLVQDSEFQLPVAPVNHPRITPKPTIKKEEPKIIDFSKVADIEEEDDDLEEIDNILEDEEEKEPTVLDFQDNDEEIFVEAEEEKEKEKEKEVDENTCEICGKVCASPRGLKVHMRVHN